MLCSVVLPCYNGQDWITASVNSILAQSYQNFELIIINDGSIDSSEKIILKYLKKYRRIVYIKNFKNFGHHRGPSSALRAELRPIW